MTVREVVYGLISGDPELNALGFGEVFAGGAPDSPPSDPEQKTWLVLNWGVEIPGVRGDRGRGRASRWDCEAWFYDRDPDFGRINAAIKRWREIMDALEAVRTGAAATDGWVINSEWQSDSRDGWDDVYSANYRSSTYTITASGD